MSKWKTYKLYEVANLSTGFPFNGHKYTKEGQRVVRGDNVTIGELRWDTDKDKRWNEPFARAEEFSLREGDIVIGMDGSRVGRNRAQIKADDLPLLLAQRVACIRHNEKSLQKFLYYQIFSKNFEDYIKSVHTGTSIPHVSLKQIGDFSIQVPDLSTQRRIAGILGSLDDKIELNRRINANLEAQAQALFQSWFVDFEPFRNGPFVDSELGKIPQGWKVGTLSEVADITMGQSPKGSSYNEEGDGIIFYQGRAEFGNRFPSIRLYTTEPTRIAEINSVLLSVRAPVGDINIAKNKCCIGRGLAAIKSKQGYNSFILYLLQSLKPLLEQYNGEGTVFGCINRKEIEGLPIIIPKESVINEFERIAENIDSEIKSLTTEQETLSALRDTLLPKLMTGEIKI